MNSNLIKLILYISLNILLSLCMYQLDMISDKGLFITFGITVLQSALYPVMVKEAGNMSVKEICCLPGLYLVMDPLVGGTVSWVSLVMAFGYAVALIILYNVEPEQNEQSQ